MFNNRNILTKNLYKVKLDKYDEALIIICKALGVNLLKANFFHIDSYTKVMKSYGSLITIIDFDNAIDLIFGNLSSKRNHDEIVLQYMIKVMQLPSSVIDNDRFYRSIRKTFNKISVYYSKEDKFTWFQEYCQKFIKPEWSNSFCFYYKSAEFYVTFYQGYFKYKRKQEDYRRKSRENYQSQKQPNINEYYRILGINITKDKAIIKTAYRKLCLRYHPDKGGSKEKFIEINQAYEYLITHV